MRIWNFSAGPAVLPVEVLQQVQDELLDWHGAGAGVMEMSHRGKEFSAIIAETEADLRELLGIPKEYKVLFLQGGATQQFAQIPLNLLGQGSADYLVTGSWSKKALKEAQRVAPGQARLAGSTEAEGYSRLLQDAELQLDDRAAYVHLCTNETIHGVELGEASQLPRCNAPLVGDLSSHILSRPVDVSRFGLIYAGAQKNIGPAGVTLVIIREDLLGRGAPTLPSVLDYQIMAENGSMLNTPPTFAIYVAGLVFQWIKRQGGVAAMEQLSIAKSRLVYGAIDESGGFYRNPVTPAARSRMNIPFTLARPELDEKFLKESREAGLFALKGHKSVGGMRASLYNALPLDGARALARFMADFAKANG